MKNRPLTKDIRSRINASIDKAIRFGPVFDGDARRMGARAICDDRGMVDWDALYRSASSLKPGGRKKIRVFNGHNARDAIYHRALREGRGARFAISVLSQRHILVRRVA